jgi:hypothetical protein
VFTFLTHNLSRKAASEGILGVDSPIRTENSQERLLIFGIFNYNKRIGYLQVNFSLLGPPKIKSRSP